MAAKAAVNFAIDHLPGGDRLVRSVGLERLEQRELCARATARRDHDFDHLVMGVINWVVDYIVDTGARIKPGESIEYGWTLLKFLERSPALLEAYELEDPFSDEPE